MSLDVKFYLLKYFPFVQIWRFKFQKFYKITFTFLRFLPGSSHLFGPPRGIYIDSQSLTEKANVSSFLINLEKTATRNMPKTNSELVKAHFKKYLNYKTIIKENFILKNSRYIKGDGGVVITEDDKILIPCSPLKNEWYPERHHYLYKLRLPKFKKTENVILLDSRCADGNFGHWMMDLMPRFYWLSKMNLDINKFSLFVTIGRESFYGDSLKALQEFGFNFKEIINSKVDAFSCKNLVIPAYSTKALNQEMFGRDYQEMKFVRELFLTDLKKDNNQNIYISRRKSIRTFEGEKLIADFLVSRGYKEVFLEDIGIKEQASLFNSADKIIGLHGSGFSNLIFCNPKTKVLELFGADFIVADFWSISNLFDLDYYAYCEDSTFRDISNYRVSRNIPISLNIKNLKEYFFENDFC